MPACSAHGNKSSFERKQNCCLKMAEKKGHPVCDTAAQPSHTTKGQDIHKTSKFTRGSQPNHGRASSPRRAAAATQTHPALLRQPQRDPQGAKRKLRLCPNGGTAPASPTPARAHPGGRTGHPWDTWRPENRGSGRSWLGELSARQKPLPGPDSLEEPLPGRSPGPPAGVAPPGPPGSALTERAEAERSSQEGPGPAGAERDPAHIAGLHGTTALIRSGANWSRPSPRGTTAAV